MGQATALAFQRPSILTQQSVKPLPKIGKAKPAFEFYPKSVKKFQLKQRLDSFLAMLLGVLKAPCQDQEG